MKKIVCAAVPALIAGIAIGFAGAKLMQNNVEEPQPDVEVKNEKKAKVGDKGRDDSAEAKARRPSRREFARQQPNVDSENLEVVINEESSERPRRGGRNFDPREVERMRTENPEEYAARTNWMAQVRDLRRRQVVSKLEFLAEIDTSTMSSSEKETHMRLQNLIEEREELQLRLEEGFASAETSGEERRAVLNQMREADRQIAELNVAERENLIKKTAEAAGFSGEDVGQIAGTIMKVIEATENNPFGRGNRVDRGWRGGRGGRR